jgi:hypothetical protein
MPAKAWEAIKARRHSPPGLISNIELGGVAPRRPMVAVGVLGACLVVGAAYFAPGWRVYLGILVGIVTGSGVFWSLNQ